MSEQKRVDYSILQILGLTGGSTVIPGALDARRGWTGLAGLSDWDVEAPESYLGRVYILFEDCLDCDRSGGAAYPPELGTPIRTC